MITFYDYSGNIYQIILPNENDITYNDLIKYIKIPENPQFDEIDFNKKIYNTIFVKTLIILYDYYSYYSDSNNCNEIKLEDEINKDKLIIVFDYKYYIHDDNIEYNNDIISYKELLNDITHHDIFEYQMNNYYCCSDNICCKIIKIISISFFIVAVITIIIIMFN